MIQSWDWTMTAHTQSVVWKSKQGSKEGEKTHTMIYSGKENNYGQLLRDYTKTGMVQKSCSFYCYLVDGRGVIDHWITMGKTFHWKCTQSFKLWELMFTSSCFFQLYLLPSLLSYTNTNRKRRRCVYNLYNL